MKTKDELINAILEEIDIQKNYLGTEPIGTIYFGGGTPSLLSIDDLNAILKKIKSTFSLSSNLEVTIETNPDDLSTDKTKELKAAGFNRLSIGIQSFDDALLKFYNRAHNSKTAGDSVQIAKEAGFKNISVDLIFGAPDQSLSSLKTDLQKALDLDSSHISIYGLTIEEKTTFGNWYKKGALVPLDEDYAAAHFELIMKTLTDAGFVQYEISNFAKSGFESRHNSAYWQGISYLGLGPSAHSFNGHSRQFNISNNSAYIKSLEKGQLAFEIEHLTHEDQINERVLIQMRTKQGLNLKGLKKDLSYDLASAKKNQIASFIKKEKVLLDGDFLRFTNSGKLVADFIIEKLII